MVIHCIKIFTIAICICCLIINRFTLVKKNKKVIKFRMILLTTFLILQITSILFKYFKINKDIVDIYSSIVVFFIIINYFKKQQFIKKQIIGVYIFFILVDLILRVQQRSLYMNNLLDMVILVLVFSKSAKLYYKNVYSRYKNIKAKSYRLNINTKIYNSKLYILRQENIKRENILNKNIDSFKELLLNSNTKLYFIDQTLTYVYEYVFGEMSLYKIKRFKTFFDKNNTDNLIILENIYNTLYSCEDLEFELKQSENEYSKYNLYPNILLEGTMGILLVKTNISLQSNLQDYTTTYTGFKNIVENIPYDIILEKDNKIIYQNKDSIYDKNMMNIILDKNIKGNIEYSIDKYNKNFYIDRIELENKKHNLIVLKNMTEQKSLVDKMNLTKKKYELFVDIISEAVFVLDHNTNKIKYTNKSFDKILQQHKLKISDMYDLINSSDLTYCDMSFNMTFKNKKIKNCLDEDVYLKFANMVLNINQKNITIGVFRDVTQNVKDEIIKKKMEEDTYSKKLKNEFLINLSHELKTPVNLIYLKNQLTRSLCEKNNIVEIEQVNLLNKELKNIQILMTLIDNLISLEKLNLESYKDNRNYYNIVEILEDIVIRLNTYKGVDIIFDTNEEEIFTFIDSHNISKVITRLLSIMYKCSDKKEVINFDINKNRQKINIHIYHDSKDNIKNINPQEKEIIDTSILLCKLVLNLYNGDLQIKNKFNDISIQLESIDDKKYYHNKSNIFIDDNFIEEEFKKIYNL